MLLSGMPICRALAALLLLSALVCLLPSAAGASPEGSNRPAAALVASSETHLSAGATELTPLGLAALVAAGWIPALVLLTRRRRQQQRFEE